MFSSRTVKLLVNFRRIGTEIWKSKATEIYLFPDPMFVLVSQKMALIISSDIFVHCVGKSTHGIS